MVLLMFFQAVYFGHFLSFYTIQLEPPKLYEEDLKSWGCRGALSCLLSPPIQGKKCLWAYSESSLGADEHGSAIVLFHTDGWTTVLCLSSPHPSSLGAEKLGAAVAYRWLGGIC